MKKLKALIICLCLLFVSPCIAGTTHIDGHGQINATSGTIDNVAIGATTPSTGRFGSASNYLDIDNGGVIALTGTAKRTLRLRPTINVIPQIAQTKPTAATRGVHYGFSMPVYNIDNEELFLYTIVPTRRDGASDFTVCLAVSLGGAEDVGDKFKFQLSWDRITCENVVLDTSVNVEVETTVLTDRNDAYDTYRVDFTIDYDSTGHEISAGDLLSWRIRRIAASALEVTNEVIVWVSSDHYTTDKMFGGN